MNYRITPLFLFVSIILIFTCCSTCFSRVIYVNCNLAKGGEGGGSWNSPFRTLDKALEKVKSGDEVWVAAGYYSGGLTLPAGVRLYGGFRGDERNLQQRDASRNITIIDGMGVPKRVVVVSPGADNSTVMDGFTIRNGGDLENDEQGGGILCSHASPTISNNIIIHNSSYEHDRYYEYGEGGGIACWESTAVIKNNRIIDNHSMYGGGIYCEGGSPTIIGNYIADNGASDLDGSGSGIYCRNCTASITGNTVIGNKNRYVRYSNKTAIICGGGKYVVSGNTVVNNPGDAIAVWSSPGSSVTNNTIAYNYGDGISCIGDCVLANNIVAFNRTGIRREHDPTVPRLENNCVYGSFYNDYFDLAPGATDISADPKFSCIRFGDFHIQPDSPCRDAGVNSFAGVGLLDMDGGPRIIGSSVDIGADESDGTAYTDRVPRVVRVSPNGSDDNDGSSWESSKRTLQAAIDYAAITGGEVWAAAGSYPGFVQLRRYVEVYGGFSGTENDQSERNWQVNKTVIDPKGQSYLIAVLAENLGQSGVIDGFTIGNGTKCGVYGAFASMTVSNCIIRDNTNWTGGAVYMECSSPVLKNNIIKRNSSTQTNTTIEINGALTMVNNIISENKGGIKCGRGSRIIGNLIFANYNSDALYCEDESVVCSNTIVNNSGAGINIKAAGGVVANNIIAFNVCGVAALGSGQLILKNNCVYGNSSANYSATSPGATDLQMNPQLVSSEYGRFRLRANSPCKNAGDNSFVPADSTDLDGMDRVLEGLVDIGAYEFNGTGSTDTNPAIVYVSQTGSDQNDGLSWQSAKHSVQAAIETASMLGGEVWVAAGSYNESLTLRPYCSLYGGFAGTERNREERLPSVYITTLNGAGTSGPLVLIAGRLSTKFDGFTITNAEQAIHCLYSSPEISNNIITKNGRPEYGGDDSASAIFCDNASPTITGNAISENGDLYYSWVVICSRLSQPKIHHNRITNNLGTAISNRYTGTLELINNVIAGNANGVNIWGKAQTSKVINNTIVNNRSTYAKGIYIEDEASAVVANNIISGNPVGILSYTKGLLTVQNNCVFGNDTDYSRVSPGTGDISVDPLFVNAASGNYHLSSLSPCIDAGMSSILGVPSLDIDFQRRVIGRAVDIGADEYQP